jgi:hypothetical protein
MSVSDISIFKVTTDGEEDVVVVEEVVALVVVGDDANFGSSGEGRNGVDSWKVPENVDDEASRLVEACTVTGVRRVRGGPGGGGCDGGETWQQNFGEEGKEEEEEAHCLC